MDKQIIVPFSEPLFAGEKKILDQLLNGVDNLIFYSIKWLNTKNNPSKWKNIDLDEIIERNSNRTSTVIKDTFNTGRSLGYNQINAPFKNTPADTEALEILQEYNTELTVSLDEEVGHAIKKTLVTGAVAGLATSQIIHELIQIPQNINGPYTNNAGELITPLISPRIRAEVIARTEYGRVVNNGTLQAFADYGIGEVDIVTSDDGLVCDECEFMASNKPYSITEVQDILPVHPNCRCGVRPVYNKIKDLDNPPTINMT